MPNIFGPEMEEKFREIIKANPNDADAHFNLGLFLENLDRFEEAIEEYGEVIRINPNYVEAHYKVGVLCFILDRYDEAEKEYRNVIKINPNLPAAHYSLGALLSQSLERYDEAEKEILKAKVLYQSQGNTNDVKMCDDILSTFSN